MAEIDFAAEAQKVIDQVRECEAEISCNQCQEFAIFALRSIAQRVQEQLSIDVEPPKNVQVNAGESCSCGATGSQPCNPSADWHGQLTESEIRADERAKAAKELSNAPCVRCGYNGPGYYQPSMHPCAQANHMNEDDQTAVFELFLGCAMKHIHCDCFKDPGKTLMEFRAQARDSERRKWAERMEAEMDADIMHTLEWWVKRLRENSDG